MKHIVGVCRFSMLGRGDWKAYRGQPEEALEQIYEQKALELFAPERMDARLATFHHLTLASLRAQTDQDFTFIVVSSDRMPAHYQDQLRALCEEVPQVVLRFVEPTHIGAAQCAILEELSIPLPDCLQFRLDDDDCVSREYIRRLRRVGQMNQRQSVFGVSFSQQYYCVTDGPTQGVYNWYSPFFSAGAAVRHPRETVFGFGHYQIPHRMYAITDPHFPNLVTHRGDNDTPRFAAEILKKRGMVPASTDEMHKVVERHFNFLTPEAMAACQLDRLFSLPETMTGQVQPVRALVA